MRILAILITVSLSLFAESKELLNNYIKINESLKKSLESELRLIEQNRRSLKEKVTDVLANDLVFSNVYIQKEYISGERDLFNNEIFKSLSEIYKQDFKEINRNIPKTTNNLFDMLKLKIKASYYKITSIKKV